MGFEQLGLWALKAEIHKTKERFLQLQLKLFLQSKLLNKNIIQAHNNKECIHPNYCSVHLDFTKLLEKHVMKYPPNKGILQRKISKGEGG